jgi:phage gp29-like protein
MSNVQRPTPVESPVKEVLPLQTIIRTAARDRWMGMHARSYTPERVEQVLRGALGGNLIAQWELFDLMEDTAPRLKKNLNELKRAVKAYDRTMKAWAEEDEPPVPEAEERAKLVSKALWTMRPKADENQNGFDDTIYDILDAWGKGIAVLEVDWEVREAGRFGNITAPKCTRWIHPRFYGYPALADWLGLNVGEIESAKGMAQDGLVKASPTLGTALKAVDGVYARFPDRKFLVCICKSKSGHPITGALLRPLAVWWAMSNFTQEWFLNLAQIFGLPIRWATYDPSTPGLLEQLSEMLADMGSQAWGAFPAGTTFELKEGPKAGTDNPQIALLDRADLQYDILILGQTLTTTQGERGSQALGTIHNRVREEVLAAAAGFVGMVLNQQLVPAIEFLNYGDNRLTPEVCLEEKKPEDQLGSAQRDEILLSQGVEMPKAWFFKRHQIPLPAADEEVIKGQPMAGPMDQLAADGSNGQRPKARVANARGAATEQLVNSVLEDLTGVEAKWLAGAKPFFRELVAKAKDKSLSDGDFVAALEKAKKEIPELFSKLDGAALAKAFYASMSAAVVNGAVRGFMRRPVGFTVRPHPQERGLNRPGGAR